MSESLSSFLEAIVPFCQSMLFGVAVRDQMMAVQSMRDFRWGLASRVDGCGCIACDATVYDYTEVRVWYHKLLITKSRTLIQTVGCCVQLKC